MSVGWRSCGCRGPTLAIRTIPAAWKPRRSITEPATQYEAFEKALTREEWAQVSAAVDGRFFLSVFDESWCLDYPYDYIKTASADITYRGLVEAAAGTGAHLIVSTGAATLEEVNRMLGWLDGEQPTLLVCTLSYPCAPSDAHVCRVEGLRVSWPDTGYSDHTRGITAASVAFERGAVLVEKHFTITPGVGGDHDFAIGPAELRWLVEDTYAVDPIGWRTVYGSASFGDIQPAEQSARHLARRSIHAKVDIAAGTQIEARHIHAIRPGDGIPPEFLEDYVGWLLPVDVTAGQAMPDPIGGY